MKKQQEDKQEDFIDINKYITKRKGNNTFRAKSIVCFFSIICICLILSLLIVCLIKFYS